jgi:protein SCO1/2
MEQRPGGVEAVTESYPQGLRTCAVILVALGVLVIAAACGGDGGGAAAGDASAFRSRFEGAELSPPRQTNDFALRDQRGDLVRFSDQRGRVLLVTFLYTKCPDVCPLIAENLNAALRELGPDRAEVRVLAVSVDPEGDSPSAVRAYSRRHRLLPEFHYLVGTRGELERVWKAYGVSAVARDPELVDHSAYTLLVDREGLGRVLFDAAARPTEIAHDVHVLLAG